MLQTSHSPEHTIGLEQTHLVARELPPISQVVNNPEQYATLTGTVAYNPSIVTAEGEWRISQDVASTEEQSMLAETGTFLMWAAESADKEGDHDAAERARAALRNLAFVSSVGFTEATSGIADSWQAYLEGHQSNSIVVFDPNTTRGTKSADYVRESVLNQLDPRYAGRVSLLMRDADNRGRLDPSHAKVVLLDDWMSSGAMMRSDAREAARILQLQGEGRLASTIEANLVVAREDQLAEGAIRYIDDNSEQTSRVLPISAYYKTPAQGEAGMYVFGTHSSVDHNDSFLRHCAEMIARETGQDVALPPAALIQRPYQGG